METIEARFAVGQVVRHLLFDYRGVIFDVNPSFSGTEEWYQQMAMSRPPKDRPWYHVFVHDAAHTTYVAERNLEEDASGEPVRHLLLDEYFEARVEGRYRTRRRNLV